MEAFSGAPQTVYSDHFLHTQALDGPMGYKLEVGPLHPVLAGTTVSAFGPAHAQLMGRFAHIQGLLALLRDGFHPESAGGRVTLNGDGSPQLDYPLTPYFWDGARRALLTMAEIQFAAGADGVRPVHELVDQPYRDWNAAKQAIAALPMQKLLTRVVSAHVMGGCAMSGDALTGVVAPDGLYRGIGNLSVHDGSLFPTSIGANPQLSIYGITARLASGLAQRLGGKG